MVLIRIPFKYCLSIHYKLVILELLGLNISFVKLNINIIENRQRAITSAYVFQFPSAIWMINTAAISLNLLSQAFQDLLLRCWNVPPAKYPEGIILLLPYRRT